MQPTELHTYTKYIHKRQIADPATRKQGASDAKISVGEVSEKVVTRRVWTSRLLTMRLHEAQRCNAPDEVRELERELDETKSLEIAAEARVRVVKLEPLGASSLNVTFDILPTGYTTESYSSKMSKWGSPAGRSKESCQMTEAYLNHKMALHRSDALKDELLKDGGAVMSAKQIREWDTINGLEIRAKLQGAFAGSGDKPSIAHHHCSGLALETLINLKDLDDNSRFLRAVFMLAATVLYYPVIQSTLPVITCFPFEKYRYWDTKAKCETGVAICPAWQEANSNDTEVVYYLSADMSEKCYEGYRFRVSFVIALIVLGMCVLCPVVALFRIRKSKHAAEGMAKAAALAEGRKPREKKTIGFCRQLFMGTHREPSRRENIEFEKRILRDPYSSLYGMCEQRAYYWFIVDLLRKAAVTCIYTFGGEMDMYLLLIFFVLFAINHDIAQPYRGRTENLFAFITLMFIIILIHTSTIVTYGSVLPMIIAGVVVLLVFVIFFLSFIYAKKAEKEALAAEEKIKRKAQDLWGQVASKVLKMDPSESNEEDMKRAFALFDSHAAEFGGEEDVEEEEEEDGEGEIDVKELRAFRDSDRKLVPRKEGQKPLEPFGFEATDDEIDAMAYEADNDGEGKIDYDEFVSVIFSSWERRQQSDHLKKWLYKNYVRTDVLTKGVQIQRSGGMRAKFLREDGKDRKNTDLLSPVSFNGLLDSLGKLPSHSQDCTDHPPPGLTYAIAYQASNPKIMKRANATTPNHLNTSYCSKSTKRATCV